jgi:hypothetical protein
MQQQLRFTLASSRQYAAARCSPPAQQRCFASATLQPGSTIKSTNTPGSLTSAFVKLLQHQTATLPAASSSSQSGSTERHEQQQIGKLLHSAADLLTHLQPHQASLILYVCAKRQLPCSQQLLFGLLQQLQPHQLQQLPPAGLVNALWALAVLQLNPGKAWMDAVYANSGSRSSSCVDAAGSLTRASRSSAPPNNRRGNCTPCNSSHCLCAFNKHQHVQLLWSVARLQERPPGVWLQGVLAALQPQLQTLSPTELTNAIWAVARIGFRPGRQWLGVWFLASRRALPHSSADCIACQVASLGVLRLTLSSGGWLGVLRAAVGQQLHTMQSRHIATVLCGLAKRRSAAPPHWLRIVLKQQLLLLGGASSGGSSAGVFEPRPRDVAATVWSLPLLLHPTAVEWGAQQDNAVMLRQLAAISLPLLRSCSSGELVQLAVGFARLGFYPGAHWLKTHENAVAQHRLSLADVNRVRLQAAMRRLWKDS